MGLRAAILQYCASGRAEDTLPVIDRLVRQAAADGAQLASLPECASFLAESRTALFEQAEDPDNSPSLSSLIALVRDTGIYLHIGSLMMRDKGSEKCANRGYLISPKGEIISQYDKIHMFTASVGDGKEYREADSFEAGRHIVSCNTPIGHFGLSICYDVRFPHLYRQLARKGAQILLVPAAFTEVTGRAHWHILLRARAIETGCFVLAAAQIGTHADGRRTFGHGLVIAPWGEVIADAGQQEEAVLIADLNFDDIDKARAAIPSLSNHQLG